jgi:hypothetical protein
MEQCCRIRILNADPDPYPTYYHWIGLSILTILLFWSLKIHPSIQVLFDKKCFLGNFFLLIFGQFFICFLKILVTFEPQNRFHFSKGWSGSADSSLFGWKRKPNWKLNLDNYTFFKAWKSMKWLKSYDLFIANVISKNYNIISCWPWVF